MGKCWRRLQFMFAFSFSCFLIAGAIPHRWLPRSWRPAAASFSRFQFERLRVLPGVGVFNFTKELNPLQPTGSCIEMDVRTRDGKIQRFEDFKCPNPKGVYTFFQNPSRTFYYNLSSHGANATLHPHTESLFVKAIAEYYCRKFDGESTVVRFITHYQNLLNRNTVTMPSVPQAINCSLLRAAKKFN